METISTNFHRPKVIGYSQASTYHIATLYKESNPKEALQILNIIGNENGGIGVELLYLFFFLVGLYVKASIA